MDPDQQASSEAAHVILHSSVDYESDLFSFSKIAIGGNFYLFF